LHFLVLFTFGSRDFWESPQAWVSSFCVESEGRQANGAASEGRNGIGGLGPRGQAAPPHQISNEQHSERFHQPPDHDCVDSRDTG